MAAIPQVDVNVTLNDTGYAMPFVHEGDGSYTFGTFALIGDSPGVGGINQGTVGNVARFPWYNSGFSPFTEPQQNFNLTATLNAETVLPIVVPYNESCCLHLQAGLVLVLDFSAIFTTGAIGASAVQAWPGTIDYDNAGMSLLTIANQSNDMSFAGVAAIVLDDASYAFCLAANTNGFGTLPAGTYILIVKPDLSTSGWLPDQMNIDWGVFCSSTWLNSVDNKNYQLDLRFVPTVSTYTVTYNFGTGETTALLASGDVSSDAANGLTESGSAFLTRYGAFGIDSTSGNNTGCWYCALDCTAFGAVTFTMPDASLGPSSSPTVWNNFNSSLDYSTYPQVDEAGNWWWIRLALCDGGGAIIIEPLTMEVYKSGGAIAQPGRFYGTHVAFAGAAAGAGGTK